MATKFNAAFWKWFGKSKVVDAKGRPLVVYHGTWTHFHKFDVDFTDDGGFHFGTRAAAQKRLDDDRDAESPAGIIIPAYLSIPNPKRLGKDPFDADEWWEVIQAAKESGHDGIVYPNSVEGGESWVAFHPSQIKLAKGNDGTWDADDPDIRSNPAGLRFRTKSTDGGVGMETIAVNGAGHEIGEAQWWYNERHKMLKIEYLCVRRKYRTPENSIAMFREIGRIAKRMGARYVAGEVTWKGAMAAGIFALGAPEYVSDDINEYPWREAYKMLPDTSPEHGDCGSIEDVSGFFVRTRV